MRILETRDLHKVYGTGDTEVRALDGVNLSVENGEFVAIVGTSGSGKSTLLHMLGGLDRPTSGSVMVDGKDIFSLKDEALTILRRRKIGFVFQSYNLVPVLGSLLCTIIGIVGVLNFFNAMMTSILSRRREFAVLQAVGMTGKQLEEMLIWEGLLYTLGSGLIAGLLSAVVNPLAGRLLEQSYWFYSYHYTISPVLLMLPVFLLLGCTIPAGMYHQAAKSSIVQQLREAEV